LSNIIIAIIVYAFVLQSQQTAKRRRGEEKVKRKNLSDLNSAILKEKQEKMKTRAHCHHTQEA